MGSPQVAGSQVQFRWGVELAKIVPKSLTCIIVCLPFFARIARLANTHRFHWANAKDTREMGRDKRSPGAQESQYMPAESNGMEPMTMDQAARLKMLADEMHDPRAFEQGLSRREASRRIDVLREKIRIWELPPHTD